MSSPAILTPSFAGDLERLVLLRESMLAVGVTMDHVVVADTEDMALMRRALPSERLHLVSTAEVLRSSVERARRLGDSRHVRGLTRLLGRPHVALVGWWAQQLVKLAAGPALARPWFLCVDSDTIFVRPTYPEHWTDGEGRVVLLEHVDFPSGPAIRRYDADSRRLLQLPPETPVRLTYVANGVPLVTSLVQRMLDHLSAHSGRPWERTLIEGRGTEYTTYGLYVRHIHQLRDVTPMDFRRYWLFQDPRDESALEEELREQLLARPELCLATVHSSHGVPAAHYRGAFERLWA